MGAYLIMPVLLAVFLLISALIGLRDRRRLDQKEREKLARSFGKPGDKEYSEGRLCELGNSPVPGLSARLENTFTVDDITWNDLDLDLVFRSMDSTCSYAGEEYLYGLLRSPRTDGGTVIAEEGLLFWTRNEDERVNVQRILQGLGRNSKYPFREYLALMDDLPERSAAKELYAVLVPAVSLGIMFFRPAAGILCLLGSFVLNIFTYFRVKREIDPYLYTLRYVMRLLSRGRALAKEPFPAYEEEKETMRSVDRAMASFKAGSGILLRENGGISSVNPLDIFLDYICMLFHLDLMKFASMQGTVRGKRKEIDDLFCAVGTIDAQISIASWRASLPFYSVPDLTGSRFDVKDLFHPLLKAPVPNSIAVSSPVLITGSNASGKSTFLKASALAALLSQSVHTAPAAAYSAGCYRVYTSMALKDDLESGESYFIVEIRSLKRVLDAAKEEGKAPVFLCVDEVLRGTNTTERISASAEILLALSKLPMQIFAATHDLELTELLNGIYTNYHFSETVEGDDVKFSYLLTKGPADSRNAIRLLRLMGYDPSITDRAQERADRYERTGRWEL